MVITIDQCKQDSWRTVELQIESVIERAIERELERYRDIENTGE